MLGECKLVPELFLRLTVNAAAEVTPSFYQLRCRVSSVWSMSSSGKLYLQYEGLIVPKETHSVESLTFAQKFAFKDDDVVAVTYPKSGQCFCFEDQISDHCYFSSVLCFLLYGKVKISGTTWTFLDKV